MSLTLQPEAGNGQVRELGERERKVGPKIGVTMATQLHSIHIVAAVVTLNS